MWKVKKLNELSTKELLNIMIERVKIFVVEQNCPYQEADNDDFDCLHVYKEINDKVVAYFRLINCEEYIKLGRVIVNKDYRGTGLGNELLNKAIEICNEKYPDKDIYAQAQAYLKDYYSKVGFKSISEVYLEDDIPHIDMIIKR